MVIILLPFYFLMLADFPSANTPPPFQVKEISHLLHFAITRRRVAGFYHHFTQILVVFTTLTDLMFLLDRVRSSVQMLQDQCCHSFL